MHNSSPFFFFQSFKFRFYWVLQSLYLLLSTITTTSYAFGPEPSTLPKPIFKLTQGQGTKVCEAYLQCLNATEFVNNHPAQGRISEPVMDGFADLKAVPLTAAQIRQLFYKLYSFDTYQDQDRMERQWVNQDKSLRTKSEEKLRQYIEKRIKEDAQTPFVRYLSTFDMDNDGIASDVVVKNNNSVYLVDPLLQRLDERRMKAIFGDQEVMEWPSIQAFPPLVLPLHVFSFNNKYYFDGFTDIGLTRGFASPDVFPPYNGKPILSVYMHEQQLSREVCEYVWANYRGGNSIIYKNYYWRWL